MPSAINSKSIKHPNTFSLFKGETQLSREVGAINQSIRLILTTAKGELFGDPNFGCRLHEIMFDYAGPSTDQSIRNEIVTALNQQEPRIFIQENDIKISTDQLNVYIDLEYSLRHTDYRDAYRHIVAMSSLLGEVQD